MFEKNHLYFICVHSRHIHAIFEEKKHKVAHKYHVYNFMFETGVLSEIQKMDECWLLTLHPGPKACRINICN